MTKQQTKDTIEEINIKELDGNTPASYGNEEVVPYDDIQMLAEKINEIIRIINEE